jgi:hypothetical protein
MLPTTDLKFPMNYNKTPVVTHDFGKIEYVREKQEKLLTSGGIGEELDRCDPSHSKTATEI